MTEPATTTESFGLCGECGAITPYGDWKGLDRDPDYEGDDVQEHLVPSTDDPSFFACPACGYLHIDDDSDPGVWEGTHEQMEAERARQVFEGYEFPSEIAPAQTTLVRDAEEEGGTGIDEILALHAAGALTPTRLSLTDPNLPWARWVAVGRLFGRIKRSTSWWIGDWILFGEGVYGEKYAQAIEVTGLAAETLMNYASVCRRVPPSRRVAALPFSFHDAVAALEPADQKEWLQKALDEGMSRESFRAKVRAAKESGELVVSNGGDPAKPSWSKGGPMESRPRQIEEAAKNVAKYAQRDGDRYLVPADAFDRLLSVLGESE